MQNDFFPLKARFCAFSQLKQNKINRRTFPMPYQTQPFGFQLVFCGSGDQLRQSFRLVNQKKIAAVFQCPGSCSMRMASMGMLTNSSGICT